MPVYTVHAPVMSNANGRVTDRFAFVRDGFPPQTNIVRVDGQRASLLTIQKTGKASTLDIVAGIKAMLPRIQAQVPPELQIKPLADQSLFVRA